MNTTTAPPRERMVVTLAAVVTTSHTFDLVAELNSLTDADRADYLRLSDHDFEEAGCEHEWQRPLVWLRASNALQILGGVDADDVDEHDLTVEAGHACAPIGAWTAAAYDALCAAVPWLTPRDGVSPTDLARLPTQLDVPINLGPR